VEIELAAIARHLSHAHVSPAATAADLRAAPPPRLLHIAAHGQTNVAAPLCSTLELADGPFLLLEAHRLNLRGTRLVVLSACETSVRPDYGDMALALAGAFLCAGARAVLASLWRVSDTATGALMERFYAALAAGAPPVSALQQAQQDVRTIHPVDWAAFQLWAGASLNTTS
jgi:CHAT domain-containing protein